VTSERKREANRRNASRSTGPRSPAGKATASANAFRHGLAINPSVQAALTPRLEQLKAGFARGNADLAVQMEAERVAEATLALALVQDVRFNIIERARRAMEPSIPINSECRDKSLPPGASVPCASSLVNSYEPSKVLSELESLHRYERRAMSSRRKAIRRLDVALRDI
jgi:hypothetical protein